MKKILALFTLLAMFAGTTYAQQCNASFSSSNTPVNPFTHAFTDLSVSSDSIVSWAWDFGDGNTSTQQNPVHSYNVPGPFIACLTITTALNCTSTYCDSVLTTNGGGTSCNASLTESTVSSTTTFSASGSGTGTPVGYNWTFGDGNSASTASATTSHTYASSGTYSACVDILFSDSCTATSCFTVTISNGQAWCNAQFAGSANGQTVSLQSSSTSSGAILSYVWDMGDGNVYSTTIPPVSHTYAQSGMYNVCLTIMTIDSCTSTYCDTVTTGNTQGGCQAGFTHYPDTTGQYTIIGVNTSTGTGLTYYWDFGDGNSSTAQYPIHQYAGAGTYVICLTVTSGPTCTSTYCDSVTVTQKINTPFTFAVLSPATAVGPTLAQEVALDLYPNPAADLVNLRLELNSKAAVSLHMMDLQGRTVQQQQATDLNAGEHVMQLETAALPAGLYLVRVQIGEKQITKKLMIRD